MRHLILATSDDRNTIRDCNINEQYFFCNHSLIRFKNGIEHKLRDVYDTRLYKSLFQPST